MAYAQEADAGKEARAHYKKGSKAYAAGDYQEAVNEFTEAYRVKPAPALLFNIAQTHRVMGHLSEAIKYYSEYLDKAPTTPLRAEIKTRIKDLQAQYDKEHPAPKVEGHPRPSPSRRRWQRRSRRDPACRQPRP